MGFNIDPVEFLPAMRVDLMDLGITIVSKVVQALETLAQIVFLGCPNNINKLYAKEVMDMLLQALEKELMELDSFTYPPNIHGCPWPAFSLVSEQPSGLFEPFAKGMNRTPPSRERRCLQLVCLKEDYQRLGSLIRAGKERGFWTSEFGQGACYPVEVVTADSTASEKAHYRDMVETHTLAQLGMSHDTFLGVKDDRFEMALARLPDAKGPRAPSKLSLCTILRNLCPPPYCMCQSIHSCRWCFLHSAHEREIPPEYHCAKWTRRVRMLLEVESSTMTPCL